MIIGVVLHDDGLEILDISIAFSVITAENSKTEPGSHIRVLASHIFADLILTVQVFILPHI